MTGSLPGYVLGVVIGAVVITLIAEWGFWVLDNILPF